MSRVPGLFITGTDTGVGKTYVGALLARRLAAQGCKVGVYKPAASGCTRRGEGLVSDDAVALWEAAGRPGELERVCPQRFEAPLAPHLAAVVEGRQLDAALLRRGLEYWQGRSEIILVEGAGGLMSPLAEREYVADLAADFAFPLLVVAPNALGCINQTLQTLIAAAAFRRSEEETVPRRESPLTSCGGLAVAGVVLNHPAAPRPEDASLSWNGRELAVRCVPPVLAEVGWGDEFLDAGVDWRGLAR